jgi:hypothetical protein
LAGPLTKEVLESCQALSDPGEAALAGELLRGALTRLAQELGGLNLEADLDPAFIAGLVVER